MTLNAKFIALLGASALVLSACGDATKTAAPKAPVVEAETSVTLAEVLADPRRDEERARDQYRNPAQTLEFFGIGEGQTVAEIWPGWYTNAIAPYLADNGGQYVAVLFPEAVSERLDERLAKYKEKYGDTEVYGDIQYGSFMYREGEKLGQIAPDNSLDVLLTFRNVHNWMGGGYGDEAFADFYAALKPGGVLGIVEHRLPEAAVQDPAGRTGYVQESYMKDMAKRAGFEFVASSEVNANPLDTADHPFGVWTLKPRLRQPKEGSVEAADFNPETYANIGESDRATLKFRKPE
jgi:predicted methyltransferase